MRVNSNAFRIAGLSFAAPEKVLFKYKLEGLERDWMDAGAKRIVEIDPQTGKLTEIAGNLPIGLPATPGGLPTNIPTGVGVGASGTIYFSSDIENAIYKVAKK